MEERLRRKELRMKRYYHFVFGLQQIYLHPYLCLGFALIVTVFSKLWTAKDMVFQNIPIPDLLLQASAISLAMILIIALILSLVFYIQIIGELLSNDDENQLVIAFSASDLRHGHPVLVSRRKKKRENVIIIERKFFSHIILETWQSNEKNINFEFCETIVEPKFEYTGKPNIIAMTSKEGIEKDDWGQAYDKEL